MFEHVPVLLGERYVLGAGLGDHVYGEAAETVEVNSLAALTDGREIEKLAIDLVGERLTERLDLMACHFRNRVCPQDQQLPLVEVGDGGDEVDGVQRATRYNRNRLLFPLCSLEEGVEARQVL